MIPRWWVMCEHDLRNLLERAGSGEDPELLLTEFYANSKTTTIGGINAEGREAAG